MYGCSPEDWSRTLQATIELINNGHHAGKPSLLQLGIERPKPLVGLPAHPARLRWKGRIERVPACAEASPDVASTSLGPPDWGFRLRRVLQAAAPATSQAVGAVQHAAGASTAWTFEPLSLPAEHRLRNVVGDEQTPKLAVIIALDEAYAFRPWDYSELVEPSIDMPHDGANVAPRYRLEQAHALEVGQVDAAPMLTLAGSTDVIGPTRSRPPMSLSGY